MRRLIPLFLLLLAAASVWAAVSYRDNPVTQRAQVYAQSIATTAAATYVTLRTLNAFLSTAQEIEVGGSFVVSGSAQPLKVLEPIDDTIERIAGLVFGVMVTTGILSVALGPVSAVGFAMVAIALSLWLIAGVFGSRAAIRGLPRRLAWYGGFLGLALPLALVISSQISDQLTEATYQQNLAVISDITATMETDALGDPEGGGFAASLGKVDDYRQLAVTIWQRADELIASLVSILAVFVFRIFILPLLLMGGLFVTVRFFARSP